MTKKQQKGIWNLNWPPERATRYKFSSREELEKDGVIIKLIGNQKNKEEERE